MKQIATLGPLGKLPGGGTWASVATIPLAYIIVSGGMPYLVCVAALTIVSIIIIRAVLPLFSSADPREIVLDEVIGCLWVLYMTHWNWFYCLVYVALFRFFDITKILGIRLFERLPSVWGILADDCVAALCARALAVVYWLFV